MEKKTIVFVQNIDFPQQGAIDIFYYAKYLSRQKNIHVKVIVSKIIEDISHDNLEIIELGKINHLKFVFNSFFLIKKINNLNKINYVYFFAQHPSSVLLQFLTKFLLRVKTIYDVVSGPIGKGFIPFLSKITIKLGVFFSNKYIVLDGGLINKLQLPLSKPHEIIPMGYDSDIFKENKNINIFNKGKGEIIFTYIGTMSCERNLDTFLKAFIENIKINKNLKLYFIGSGTGEEKLRGLSTEYLKKNIFFLGKREHKSISDYINSSDILVSYVPKMDYFEYQPPTKLIEYLACNKPVIVTNTIAQEVIMKGYETQVHKDDIESTRDKIMYCIANIEIINNVEFSLLVKDYSWQRIIKKIKLLIY